MAFTFDCINESFVMKFIFNHCLVIEAIWFSRDLYCYCIFSRKIFFSIYYWSSLFYILQ